MIVKFKLLFIILILSLFTIANGEDRRVRLLSLIDEELTEVVRLNKQVRSSRPNLLLRIAELYLEKARIIKEIENDKYLSTGPKERRNKSKKSFFKRSRRYFIKAQKTCYFILKRFKKFKGRSDVLYILAFNAKEFKKDKDAKKYFALSIKTSKKNSSTRKRSGLALAEIYFNKKQYRKALKLYNQTLVSRKSKWWTKDAYNWAWCFFHTGKVKRAIKLMEEIYQLSRKDYYYNMQTEVKRDLAFFYTESGRIKDAVSFYKKDGSNIAKSLVKVGKHLIDQGKFSQAENILIQSLKYTKDKNRIIETNNVLLNSYEKFGKNAKHLTTSKKLFKFHQKTGLNEAQLTNLIFHVKKMSAVLQKQVVGSTYIRRPKIRKSKALMAVDYFDMDSKLDNAKAHLAIFHAAETLFSIGHYNNSLEKYNASRNLSLKARDKKIERLSIDGMMASLDKKGITKNNRSKFLIPMYQIALKDSPGSKKAYTIYQRLFSTLLEKGDIEASEVILLKFQKYFPKDYKIQEAMLAKIMDFYKNKGNKQQILRWIKRINNEEFKVSKLYANKLRQLILTMQFEKVEQASNKGDKKWALKGYVSIYRNKASSKEAKKNAAYNISLLFYELGNINFTIDWLNRALSLMTRSDVKKFESTFLTLVSDFYARGRFKEAAKFYKLIYNKTCKVKSTNKKIFFENSITVYLAMEKYNRVSTLLADASRCKISKKVVRKSRMKLVKELSSTSKFSLLEKEANQLIKNKSLWPNLIYPFFRLANHYKARSAKKSKKFIADLKKFYTYSVKAKMEIPLDSLNAYAKIELGKLMFEIKKIDSIKLKFPEKTYNATLQKMFKQLDKITVAATRVFNVGSGEAIVESYKLLIHSYRSFADKITSFIPPKKSADYLSSFKKGMKDLVAPISKKSIELKKEAWGHITKNEILSKHNHLFNDSSFNIEYITRKRGILMDRGGWK